METRVTAWGVEKRKRYSCVRFFSPAIHWVTGRRQFSRQSQSEIMQNQSNLRLFWMLGYKFSWYFPVIQIEFHSAFVTKPCLTFPKPLFQNEGKSWRLFQPQRCQLFFYSEGKMSSFSLFSSTLNMDFRFHSKIRVIGSLFLSGVGNFLNTTFLKKLFENFPVHLLVSKNNTNQLIGVKKR